LGGGQSCYNSAFAALEARRRIYYFKETGSLALKILGLSGGLSHNPSAALYIDGRLVVVAEEERFVRDKYAKNRMP
jgi:hypothetical protein